MEESKKKILTKERIISAVIGLAVGIVLTCLAGWLLDYFANSKGIAKLLHGEDILATVNGKEIKTSQLYDEAKKQYGLGMLLDDIDEAILTEMYNISDDEAKEEANGYLSYYASMGYSQDDFLSANGFTSYDDFVKEVKMQMLSEKYLYDFLEGKLEEGAVEKYYNEHKDEVQTYDSEHILVRITDDVTDAQAKALAEEILAKVKEGKTFEEIENEYSGKIIHEELGFQGKNSNLEEAYINALVSMEDGTYSQELVKTSYGYHIIHRISTATLDDLRNDIIDILSKDLMDNDQYITYKAFAELRKEKGLKIYDEELNSKYDEYLKTIEEVQSPAVTVGE